MNNKKLVLQIRNANFEDFGGAERYPIFLSKSLERLGYKSVVVSKSPSLLRYAKSENIKTMEGWWWSRQNWSGSRVLLLPIYIVWQITLYFWYLQLFLLAKPSIIHIQSKDDFIAATLAGKTLRKKIIWSDHADLKHIFKNAGVWYKNPVGKLVYFCGLRADSILISSNGEKKLICENLKKDAEIIKKMTIVYNGVSDNSENYTKKNHSAFTYGIVTRMVIDKGIGEAITAFKLLNEVHPETKLILVGDGPNIQLFKSQAKDNKNIVFTGHLNDPLGEMNSLDVLLHPTYHESFSITLIEASMFGLPIITTDVGGNPEIIINNKTGLLVSPKDEISLFKAMEKLYKSKELRDTLGKNARKQYLDKFNFDDIVKNSYLKIYEK